MFQKFHGITETFATYELKKSLKHKYSKYICVKIFNKNQQFCLIWNCQECLCIFILSTHVYAIKRGSQKCRFVFELKTLFNDSASF